MPRSATSQYSWAETFLGRELSHREQVRMMVDAMKDGRSPSTTWNGSTPSVVVQTTCLGWKELLDVLHDAACHAGDRGAVDMTGGLVRSLALATPTFYVVLGAYRSQASSCAHDLLCVTAEARLLYRAIWKVVAVISDALTDAPVEASNDGRWLSHPVALRSVYGACLLDVHVRSRVEALGVLMSYYMRTYTRWNTRLASPAEIDAYVAEASKPLSW